MLTVTRERCSTKKNNVVNDYVLREKGVLVHLVPAKHFLANSMTSFCVERNNGSNTAGANGPTALNVWRLYLFCSFNGISSNQCRSWLVSICVISWHVAWFTTILCDVVPCKPTSCHGIGWDGMKGVTIGKGCNGMR